MSRYHKPTHNRRMRREALLRAIENLPVAVTHRPELEPLLSRGGELWAWTMNPVPMKRGRGGRR